PDLELLREKIDIELEEDERNHLLDSVPYLNGSKHLNQDWIEQVWAKLNHSFSTIILSYKGSVEQFITSMNPNVHLVGRVFFHLVESEKEDYPFAYMATYAAEVSQEGKSKHLPLKNALVEYGKNSRKLLELLSTVNRASEKSEFIAELVESGEIFHPIGLSADEAYTFLKEIPVYEEAGILCRIPKWWKHKSNALKLSVSVGNKTPSRLNLDALVDFNAELFLAGEAIQVNELRKLLSEAEGLAFIKGKWVEVNHERLQETLRAYEQAQKLMDHTEISMVDALRFQLNASQILNVPAAACELEVTNGEWLHSVLNRLTHPDTIEAIACGEDFHASLRVYQERGLN
ncbi:MAG: SNF2 helicase-associated domain-containing protein, partial [Bacilli bacterium]